MTRYRERRHTYATTLSWGGDEPTAELDVTVSFTVEWGSPPSRDDPGSGDLIESITVLTVDGKPWPVDLSYGFQTPEQDHEMIVDKLDDHHDDMIESAIADLAYERDEAADSRREDRW